MSQRLDLSVTLTSPPSEAPVGVIASSTLCCELLGLSHEGDLLTDPLTQQERRDLRWYLEEYWLWPYEGFAQRGKEVEALLVEGGRRLYRSVFGSPQAQNIMQQWDSQESQPHLITIVSEVPAALSLPWELLHDGHNFLALRTRHPVSIVRRLPLHEQTNQQTAFAPPLRILLVTAQPEEMGFVDPRGIARELYDELQAQSEAGTIELEFLRPPTLEALRSRLSLRKRPVHVLHFDGHGTFGQGEMNQGMLAFENTEGQLDAVEAQVLARLLQDSDVRLAVLTACQSAMGSEEDTFSSIAAQLIHSGLDAVIAMSTNVLVASTTRYAEAFYHALATGSSVAIAHEQARLALYRNPHRHLQRRHQDEAGTPIQLRDWWMPHLYLQRALSFQLTQPAQRRKKQQGVPLSLRLNKEMPSVPRYGFRGRARELLKLERWLLQGKVVVVSGFGGIGKTALAREAADWLTRTKLYERACFVSFEHGGDATMLLSILGQSLGISDGHYNPHESMSALTYLAPVLKKKRTLLIADNLESILPGGEAPLASELQTQLWDIFLALAHMRAGVLLTSRDTAFGDSRFVSDSHVALLPLRGLRPNDAYILASHLLDDLAIDPVCAPYSEVRDLLVQLDHHPLAIQLVLPALRELPIAVIRAGFEALLPRFTDDTETGRNRSLLASLEYSLQRLSTEQRILLSRLVLFQGGASEDNLLAITQIPEDEWVKLCKAMEQAALLRVERVHKDIAAPFLRFHPVLTPFLRQGLNLEIEAPLFGRYIQRYYDLARLWYMEDKGNPRAVRSLVRRELPNLIQTLHLLLQMDDQEAASNMSASITDFLDRFGLWRQRDELRRSIAAAATTDEVLTQQEWLNESGQGDDEYQRSDIVSALKRFSVLLTRVEALPEGNPLGQNSYIHCTLLHRLARCFKMSELHEVAEEHLHKALTIVDTVIKEDPTNRLYIRERSLLLSDLGDIALLQGYYEQARKAYDEALLLVTQLGDRHAQAVTLGELGALEQAQGMHIEARSHLSAARDIFHKLNEPTTEADMWYQLGRLAEEQHSYEEAEHCYRQSLALDERLGDMAAVVKECNQLALVAQYANRPGEAESWYKRALELEEQLHSSTHQYATLLNNLANLLLDQVWTKQAPASRLVEARSYAERALSLDERTGTSTAIWTTLYILSVIASLEGQTEKAQEYRRREREAFATFAGNRYHINRQHGSFIVAVAAAAENPELQAIVEEVLVLLEAKGWHIAAAISHIWSGERNWHLLADGLDRQDALLILRVLETLASSPEPEVIEE